MKIVVGLGNPGIEYEGTRHNVGFMVLDAMQEKLEFPEFKEEKKFKALISTGEIAGEKVILMKPQTFMNKSGDAVRLIKDFYKVLNKNIWVIYDDVDLPIGSLRIRKKGSAGTHNGMKSVIGRLGAEKFPRVRIGIESRGELTAPQQNIVSFVLKKFNYDEKKIIPKVINEAVKTIKFGLNEGVDNAMNKFNAKNT